MLCPGELAAIINAIAVAIGQGKSGEELSLLGAVFTQIGDTLATMSVQQSNIDQCCQQQNHCNN